ncbi:MAG: hypothetical protein K6343_02595 [Caldisericaceae bacterium]
MIIILSVFTFVFGCAKFQKESTSVNSIKIPVVKANEIFTIGLTSDNPLSKKPLGEANIIVGEINGKILALKGDYITFLGMEQTSFSTGRTLILIDPTTSQTEALIKEPIVIKAFPSHSGKYIAILTKDLHLGVLDLDTKSFEVVFKDLLLVPSTDYISNPVLAWSLDDSQIFFSAYPKGWGTVFLNDDSDLYMYDTASKKVLLVRGSYLLDKYDKFVDVD